MKRSEQFKKDVEYHIDTIQFGVEIPEHLRSHAKEIYAKYHTEKRAFSRPAEVFALGVVYMSAKILEFPVTTHDLTRDNDIEENHVVRAYKDIQKHLAQTEDNFKPFGASPEKFIERYGKELGADQSVIDEAKDILSATQDIMRNRANSTQAAASLYTATVSLSRDDFSQRQLSQISGASEATIRNRYNEQKAVVIQT